MSEHRAAMLAYGCQLHATAVAELQGMIAVNQLRQAQGKPPAYPEDKLEQQMRLIGQSVIDPSNYS